MSGISNRNKKLEKLVKKIVDDYNTMQFPLPNTIVTELWGLICGNDKRKFYEFLLSTIRQNILRNDLSCNTVLDSVGNVCDGNGNKICVKLVPPETYKCICKGE